MLKEAVKAILRANLISRSIKITAGSSDIQYGIMPGKKTDK